MMALFFFFTVILMLNVLIALINVAFAKGDDGWRLVWIESRLRHIESAENMSYHIPGFRQTYDYFPREIYYSATPKQVHEHWVKYDAKDSATEKSNAMEEQLARPTAADDDEADDDYMFEGEEVDESMEGEGMAKDLDEEEVKEDSGKTDGDAVPGDEEVEGLKITDSESAAKTTDGTADKVVSSGGVSDGNVLNYEGTATLSTAAEQDDVAEDVPKDPSPLQRQPPSEEQATIAELNSQVGELNSQVGDLKSQVLLLRTQLSNQGRTQQEQFTIQQEQFAAQNDQFAAQKSQFAAQKDQNAAQKDQFSIQQEQVQKQLEELKNLLLMRSSTA
ncbi:hypothetical protein EDD21DRAFT_226232 [Dissophora ornata]|nr:hypothetical protein EDD21DRAFT_226232 [Dissophora ornata]